MPSECVGPVSHLKLENNNNLAHIYALRQYQIPGNSRLDSIKSMLLFFKKVNVMYYYGIQIYEYTVFVVV